MHLLTHTGSTTRCLGDLPLRLPHSALRIQRASHVWPVHPIKRAAFRLLRLCFGERGRVAVWTRSWRGPWQVVLMRNAECGMRNHTAAPPAPHSAPRTPHFQHPSRRVCLDWERRMLLSQRTHY
jgi:hypothetical protein